MCQLLEIRAQEIVDKMMKDIPYNINIMNEHGIIIGSGMRYRIGSVHKGALEALRTGNMVEITEDREFEKKGTNEPIIIDEKKVGVIGISGNPQKVRPFCNIVKTAVTLLIEQGIALKNLENESIRKKTFIESLLNQFGEYSQTLQKEAAEFNLNLFLQTRVVFVKNFSADKENVKLLLKCPSFFIKEGIYLIMVQDNRILPSFLKSLLDSHNSVLVGVGNYEQNIAASYKQAKSAVEVLEALKFPCRKVMYEEVSFLCNVKNIGILEKENVIYKLKNYAELIDTLKSLIYHNGNISSIASDLMIHRNTLQYRLKRIHSLTGKDPYNFLELFELTHHLLTF